MTWLELMPSFTRSFWSTWVQGACQHLLISSPAYGSKWLPLPPAPKAPLQDEEVRSRGEENLCFGSTVSKLWTLACLLPSGPQMAGPPSLSPGSHPTVGGLSHAGVFDRQLGQGVACWKCILPVQGTPHPISSLLTLPPCHCVCPSFLASWRELSCPGAAGAYGKISAEGERVGQQVGLGG